MKITAQRTRLWWLRKYKWQVACPDAYNSHSMLERDEPGRYFWKIKSEYQEWLSTYPVNPVKFCIRSRPYGFSMMANKGKISIGHPPPLLLFNSMSDIILFKLSVIGQ